MRSEGRLRIHVVQEAYDMCAGGYLCWFLEKQEYVTDAKVYERTADAVICYKGDREEIIAVLKSFSYEKADVPENVAASSGRELNSTYQGEADHKGDPALWRKAYSSPILPGKSG